MSSQSDEEHSIHTDDETHSDKESFSEEHNHPKKKDRKKKLKSKDLLRSPDKSKDVKSCPETCAIGKESSSDENTDSEGKLVVGDNVQHPESKNETISPPKSTEDNNGTGGACCLEQEHIIVDDNSNSEDKRVGAVGDNIKQLVLNEKNGRDNNGQPFEVSQDTHSSRLEVPVSTNSSNVQELQVPERDSLIDTSMTSVLSTSTGLEVVHAEVPHNTANESSVALVSNSTDIKQLSTSVAIKRQTCFFKDDTLEDVSDITTDLTDIHSDSNSTSTSGMRLSQSSSSTSTSGRRLSQASSDAMAEGMSGSSENKGSVDESEDIRELLNRSNGNESKSDQNGSNQDYGQAQIELATKDSNCNAEERKTCAEKVTKKRVSNGHSSVQPIEETIHKETCDTTSTQQSSNLKYKESVNEELLRPTRPDPYSSSSQRMIVDDDNGHTEPMEEHNIPVDQNPPEVEAREDNSSQLLEKSNENNQIQDQQEMEVGNQRNDQDNDQNNESPEEANALDGQNNGSEQESNSDFQNFAHVQNVGYREEESATSDSGIENSLAIFTRRRSQDLPDNSSNEGSALVSSGGSGGVQNQVQSYQKNWLERTNSHRSSTISPVKEIEVIEAIAGPSDVGEPQAGHSNSSAIYVKSKVLKVAQMEVIEDIPMEYVEQFASTTSEGEKASGMPSECKDENTDEDNKKFESLEVQNSDSTNPEHVEVENDFDSTESLPKESEDHCTENPLLKTDTKEENPDQIAEDCTTIRKEFPSGHLSSIHPSTSQRLVDSHRLTREDSDPASCSSLEHSRDSSLADMDDAVESSDSHSRESEPQQTAAQNPSRESEPQQTAAQNPNRESEPQTAVASGTDVLQGKATSSPGLKPQRVKRRTRKSSGNDNPHKRRKDVATCGQEASSSESPRKQKPDSDDESTSRDDTKHDK